MKILMISGTYHRHSKTWLMLDKARQYCEAYDIEVEIAELCDYAITVSQPEPTHQLYDLINKITQADAIIFSTPNYQGSMSGLLKVAIDHIPEAGLQHKPVGLIAVSGGIGRMSLPTSHLRDVVTALEGLAVSTDVACYAADFKQDENGNSFISCDKIKSRIKSLIEEIERHTRLAHEDLPSRKLRDCAM